MGESMRSILILFCFLAVSFAARAQGNLAAWSNLNALREGEKIQVREMNKARVTGTFMSVSDAAITVQAQTGPEIVQRQDVRKVKRMKVKHRWANSLVLAGAGAGIGFAIGRAEYHPCPKEDTFCLDFGDFPGDIGLVTGLVGGGVIGALLPIHETVYSVSSH
jgi:hypothetical protein